MSKIDEAMARYENRSKNKSNGNLDKNTQNNKMQSAMQRYEQKFLGLDTFESDLKSIAKTVDNAFNGWQSVDTMNNTRDSVLSMYNRINSYNNYQKEYGGVDLTDLAKTYETALKILDEKAKKYSKYKTKTEYDEAVKDAKTVSDFYGLSTSEIEQKQKESKSKSEKLRGILQKAESLKPTTTTTNKKGGAYFKAKEQREKEQKAYEDYLKSVGYLSIEEIENELSNLDTNIAYTTTDGQNITWDDLYEEKKYEEDHNALYTKLSVNNDWKDSIKIAKEYVNPSSDEAEGWLNVAGYVVGGTDKPVNKLTYLEENAGMIAVGELNGGGSGIVDYYMTTIKDEEKDIYNYYFGIGEYEKADEYLENLKPKLKRRFENDVTERAALASEEHPVLASAFSVVTNLASGIEYIADTGKYVFTGELDTNHSAEMTNAIRGTVMQQVDWDVAGWDAFDFLYNTGMSALDSAVSKAAFGKFGGIALGLSAAAQSTNDALNRGMSKGQAFMAGLASGVFEGIFETWSIAAFDDGLKDLKRGGFRNWSKFIGKQMWNNAKEETLTDIADIVYDTFVNGEFSQYETSIRQYISSGMSESDAKRKVATELGLQVAEAAGSGALMGFGFGTIGSIGSYRYANRTGKIITANGQVDSLFDTAKGLNDADVNKLLESYENNRKENKLSNAQIGSLFSAVYEKAQSVLKSKKATAEQKASAATVEGSLRNMLLQKNGAINTEIDQEVLANSDILTDEERKLVNTPESELTAEQRAEKQEVIQKVMEEVVKSYQNAPENGVTSGIEILSVTQKNNKRRHTTAEEQNFIKRVAKALGVKVEFTQITADLLRSYGYDFKDGDILPDGFYDRNTKTVHIGYTVYNPVTFILKHELTHFGEGTAQYKKFVEIVKKSKAYKNWLETKTKDFREWNSVQANTNGKIEVRDLETIYLTKIARERGYKLQKDGVLSESDRNELHCEMIADFVGDCIFSGDIKKLENMLSGLDYKERNIVVRYILDFISYLKKKLAGNKEIVLEISRLEDAFNRMLSEAVDTNKETPTESGGDLQFSIVNLDSGKSYVQASRRVISGNKVSEWRSQISEFFNKALKNGPIEIQTIEGDILTISKDTANKARDKHISENGVSRELTDEEFLVKLHAESHIDELTEISISKKDVDKNKKIVPDKKNHDIAKDGFSYRTVYFQDFDGSYYRVTLSVGENNGVSTVYNVGKMKAEDIPNGNIVSAIGSKADMSSANSSVTQKLPTVNSKNTQESGNNSKNNLQFSFARVQDDALISEAESKEKELLHQGKAPDIVRMKIWDDYGIIRDSAGEWIYEIDDSEMEFLHLGNAVTENPEIMELYKLENAKRLSKEKGERLNSLRKKYGYSILRSGKLSDFVKHPKLFDIFPQLKDIKFQVRDLKGNTGGYYDNKSKTLVLDLQLLVDIQEVESGRKSIEDFDEDPYTAVKKTVIHEIQHALQVLEDREPGASEEYWIKRFARDGEQPIKPDTGEELSPKEAYVFTKGEYEARATADRLNMTKEQRRDLFNTPWLGWGETISARETATANSSNTSIPTNAEYMSAIKDGDAKQIREIVDNAARARGYSERLYHQTGADFTEFNTDNEVAGKFDWELPTGIFLKPSNTDIGLKGKKQMELFAKAENPLHFKDRAEAREFWSENIDGYREAAEEVEKIDNEYREKDDDAIMELQSYMRQWKKENPNADKRDIYTDTKYQKLADKESAIMDEWEAKSDKASLKAKRLINDFIAESGYDGIVIEHDADGKNRYTKSYIVFDSSQLKSAEPITYDNNGNVISLSKRFDQGKKDIRFSVPSVDSYTEEQYNSFGWVRANNVLSASEYETLLSRYADYKHNKDNYPTTRFGEAVIHSSEHPDVIMYVKGKIESPEITKVVRIVADDSSDVSKIHERIIKDEYKQEPFPYKAITAMYGEEYIRLDRKRNNASFRQYTAREEGRGSQESDTVSRSEQNGTGSQKQNNAFSEAGLKKPAFSMPSETRMLLDMYENGEISKTEYQTAIDKYWDDTIAELGDSAWAEQLRLIKDNIKLHGRIKRQNEQLARRRSEISQEITAQREERATKQKNIEYIRKTVSRIDKMLRTNSNTKHVPEELKTEITQFVSVFVANDRSPFDKKDLRNIYLTYSDALREGAAEGTVSCFDEDVLRDLKILRDQLDGKTLRDLNYHETLLVRNIVDNFAQIIKWGNELFLAGKEYEYNEIGHRAMYELIDKKSKRENSFTNAIDSGIVYANMTPAYFFDEVGGVFKTLFDDVVEAQNKWYRNVENAKTYIRQMKEKYHYSEWENDMFDFTTENGDKIRISHEQAMLLYATAKREYGNDIQKAEHLFRGGVVIEPSPKKLKDIVKKFKTSDEKGRKRIAETFSDVVDSGAHRITPQDVLKVKRWLSAEQLEYADALVDYLSKDMAALGNETSLQLYGIRKYNEDYYIPYNSAQNFLYSQPGVSNEARLKHQSFTKNTVEGANNPLVLSDFSAVCADHINRMCMYNALTIPLENMNRIFNYGISGEGINTKNIKSEIERVYGESAVSYIKTFIEDMNGNVRTSQTDKAINRWISKFKKGAVFASASVVVQQPSAIIRAMAYIKPKYFTKTTLKFAERDYQQCVKYAPVAGIKEMGRFDTGVGAATTNWLLQETPHGIKNKVKALFSKDSTYRDDKMSYFAAKADEITWAHIWAAVKAEIADTTDLKVDSEEFFNACGKRFTEVINYTQVYDSTLSRSQMMRSKSTGAQMLTAFMSEPTVSLNLLMNAARKAKSGTKEGRHYAARAVAAFVGSVALNAFLKSFVTAARDDDEEETYLEKYTGEFISNFLSDVNPLSLIPFVKDVISIFEGYTVERADMNLFSDLAQSFETFMSDTKSGYEKFESIAGSLAAFLGLPVKNVLRDLRAVYNLCNDIFVTDKVDSAVNEEVDGYLEELSDNETYESLNEEDKEKLEKNITKTVRAVHEAELDKGKQDEFDELYAEKRKSQKAYSEMRKKMLAEGYTEAEIADGVEIARIAYMKSIGVDVGDYLLYEIYCDKNKNGQVSKKEREYVREMDIDDKIKDYFLKQHK